MKNNTPLNMHGCLMFFGCVKQGRLFFVNGAKRLIKAKKTIQIALTILFLVCTHSANADAVVMVDCDYPEALLGLNEQLVSIKNHVGGNVVVVIRGGCSELFRKKNESKYIKEVTEFQVLSDLDVVFLIDNNSFGKSANDLHDFQDFVEIESNVLAKVIRMQQDKNYAYVNYMNIKNIPTNSSSSSESKSKSGDRFKFLW